jgi:antitoxin component of RelBE/YafQ-DinJ toxin-antitoxin module
MKLSIKKNNDGFEIITSTWLKPESNDTIYLGQSKKWEKKMKNLIFNYLDNIGLDCKYIVEMTLSRVLNTEKSSFLKFNITILNEGYMPTENLKKQIRELMAKFERFEFTEI